MTWFKPKRFGYGASPAGWKGWAATFGFLAAELALAWLVLLGPLVATGALSIGRLLAWLVLSALLTVGFIELVKAKTAGEWRWRWGKDT